MAYIDVLKYLMGRDYWEGLPTVAVVMVGEIIKGDANSLSIAAASIIAKVTMDKIMANYDQEFPGYDFSQNAGYGTTKHLEGIEKHGVTPIHRTSFEPIKTIISETSKR